MEHLLPRQMGIFESILANIGPFFLVKTNTFITLYGWYLEQIAYED